MIRRTLFSVDKHNSSFSYVADGSVVTNSRPILSLVSSCHLCRLIHQGCARSQVRGHNHSINIVEGSKFTFSARIASNFNLLAAVSKLFFLYATTLKTASQNQLSTGQVQ